MPLTGQQTVAGAKILTEAYAKPANALKEQEIDHSLVARYVAGELRDEELEYFEKVLLSREDYAQAVWEATLLINGRSIESMFDVDKGLEHLQSKVATANTRQSTIGSSIVWHRWIKFAAVFLLSLLGTGVFIALHNSGQPPKTIAQMVTYQAEQARKRIVLPDSSVVLLNFQSQISFNTATFSSQRVLHLKGEAYLEVQSHKNAPFEVHSSSGIVRVLGTRFSVSNAPGADFVTEVYEGSVEVLPNQGADPSIKLTSGQVLKWKSEGHFSFDNTTHDTPQWVSGILQFEKTTLAEVFKTLETYYGIKITVQAPQLLNRQITGTFKQASLELVLKQIAKVYPFHYTLEKDHLIITSKQK